MRKVRRKRLRAIAVLTLIALIGAGVGVYFILNPSSARMRDASIDSTMEVRGVIIRNETVVQRGDAYHVQFLVEDGDYVQSAQPVVTTFTRGYDVILEQITALEQQIYQQQLTLLQLQQGSETLPDSLVQLNNSIDECVRALALAAQGEGEEDILTLDSRLESLMNDRSALLASLVTADEALAQSQAQLSALESGNSYRTTLVNDGSAGYISFTTDGYESALNPDQLNTAQVADILSSYGSATPSSADLYRITSSDFWYVAFNTPIDSAERLQEGQTYSMMMEGSDTVYAAYCRSARTYTSNITFVLEINADVKPVLNTRMGTFTFARSASGVSVRLDGLVYENGVPSLMVKQSDGYVSIPVYILSSDDKNAIVVARDSNIQLRSGLRYQIP
ncbi:MAG: HlyD family efflux transporter periplasmic adaptor subunit [Clostridia bacterium]|nr:HlyD family efflux transporter periplasmic adaptor subunit [Clostridia bacterium]